MKKEKRKINKKRVVIFVIILLILIIGIVLLVRRNTMSNVGYVAPNRDINEIYNEDDGMLKYENNIQGVEIGDREVVKKDKKYYIKIEISNTTEEDKFDLPVGIEFINSDSEVIFQTGYVQNVLLKGMTDDLYAEITSQIAEGIQHNEIDHIVIKLIE